MCLQAGIEVMDRGGLLRMIAVSAELDADGCADLVGEANEDDTFTALESRQPCERAFALRPSQVLECPLEAGQTFAFHRAAGIEQIDRRCRTTELSLIGGKYGIDEREVIGKGQLR